MTEVADRQLLRAGVGPMGEPADPAQSPGLERLHLAALLRARAEDRRAVVIEGTSESQARWCDLAVVADYWQTLRRRERFPLLAPGRRAPVALHLADPVAMASHFVGALAAGVVVVPIDPNATDGETSRMARELGVRLLITDRSPESGPVGGDLLRELGVEVRSLANVRNALMAPSAGDAVARDGVEDAGDGADVAMLLMTSGTTGEPKVIPLSAGQLLGTARAVAQHHRLGPGERGYSPLPLFHINGLVVGVLAALMADASIVVDRRFSATTFWSVVDRHHVTWLNLVPAIITILGNPGLPLPEVPSQVRFARSASAPLSVSNLARFQERTGLPVVETYGMTEAASQITANPITGARKAGSVGLPVGTELRIVSGSGAPLPAGQVGTVQIKGPTVVREYWGSVDAPDARRPATDDEGWLSTGDLGSLDEDGYLWLRGRGDDVINRGGEKLYPREVEEVLLDDPEVATAIVVGRAHPTVGSEPVAFVTATGPRDEAAAAALVERLHAQCRASLASYKRPSAITVVDALPAGPTGKIKRAAVRAMVNSDPERAHP